MGVQEPNIQNTTQVTMGRYIAIGQAAENPSLALNRQLRHPNPLLLCHPLRQPRLLLHQNQPQVQAQEETVRVLAGTGLLPVLLCLRLAILSLQTTEKGQTMKL